MRYKEAGTATIIFFADNNIHTVVRDPDEFTDTGPTIEEDVDTRQQMARFADIVGIPVHGSIVNLEFGIPAVVGTSIGTERIKHGQQITVDGDAGTLTRRANKTTGNFPGVKISHRRGKRHIFGAG